MDVLCRILTFACMFLLLQDAEGFDCSIGQEPDPNAGNRYRWVIPVDDPCKCTRLRVGGLNTRTPCRHFNVTYYDTFLQSENAEEVRNWLNCQGSRLPSLILNRTLGYRLRASPCHDVHVNMSSEYNVSGDSSLVKMVPGPDVADHACAVSAQAGSYMDLGDFKDTCISDLGLCESMTWSLWLKINTSSGFTGERYYISSGGQTRKARGLVLLYRSETNKFELHVRTAKSTVENKYNTTKIPLNTWFHLAITIKTNETVVNALNLYVDGELKPEDDDNYTVGDSILLDTCTKLYLGMSNTCNTNENLSYSGSAAYSNLMVFGRLLNKDEIKNLNKITN